VINSLWIDVEVMEGLNNRLQAKYADAGRHVVKSHEYLTNDAELVLVAYGSPARICRTVVDLAREEGMNIGLLRPITLFPFPERHIADLAASGKRFMAVEMSAGQMVEDVRLAVNGRAEVLFHGRTGGAVPTPTEILNRVRAAFGRPPVVSHYVSKEASP
jgi:2-oxoglutarate ferredoxin oxidoreductase subunit alpha